MVAGREVRDEAAEQIERVTLAQLTARAVPFLESLADSGRVTPASRALAGQIARRLRDVYPVLYSDDGGLVAHECILDLRPLKEATGLTVDDVATAFTVYPSLTGSIAEAARRLHTHG